MPSFGQAPCALSSLLIILLLLSSGIATSSSEELGRTEECVQRRDTVDGQGTVAKDGPTEDTSTITIISTTIVSSMLQTQTPVLDHRYHRHEIRRHILDIRDATKNSTRLTTATTTNSAALSCYTNYSKWRTGWMSWRITAINAKNWSTTKTTSTLTQILDTVATVYPSVSLSTYRLCDGSPRVDFEPLTLTSKYTSTLTYEAIDTVGTPTYSVSSPCTPSSEECQYLYDDSGLSWDDLTLMALCGSPTHLGLPCLIAGGPVELAYFPVTTVSGDKCHAKGSTITNTGGPTTISALGTTLTSGSVYLSFKSLYAFQEGFGNRIGPAFTNFIMPLPSSAISTQCGGWFSAQGPGTPLNYADLNFPWPASAYNCMNRCSTDVSITQRNGTNIGYTPPPQCSTIWSDLNPILAMPTEVRNLVPAWSTCSMWDAALPNFVFDPPRALVEGTAVPTPTVLFEVSSSTTPAAPAATSYTALAETMSQTSAPSSVPSTVPSSVLSAGAAPTKGVGSTGIMIEFSVDGHTFTASAGNNAFSIEGQTISVGGPAQIIEGETISLGLAGFVVNSTTTIPFSSRASSSSPGTTVTTASTRSVNQSASAGKQTTKSGGPRLEISWKSVAAAAMSVIMFL